VIMLSAKSLPNPLRDLLHGANRGNVADQIALLVPVEHRRGLLAIGCEPGGDRLRIVVGSVLDRQPLGEPVENLVMIVGIGFFGEPFRPEARFLQIPLVPIDQAQLETGSLN